ncbi:MAG: hypothetical protein ACK2TT_07450 [Anaerolineales bacterium]|jgi:hypothetical protein
MRSSRVLKWIMPFCWVVGACTSSTCPPDTIKYLAQPYPPDSGNLEQTVEIIEIGRQEITFDQVISGPLCNNSLSGVVYITCDIQIPAWEEESTFLKDCDLEIAEGTVIYVDAHGDQPYYEGCSCHE